MSNQQNIASQNLRHALNLVLFEQWLRFYFIAEEDGKLFIRMPEEWFEQAMHQHPELSPVAAALNNREIDHQAALNALCDNMMSGPTALDGQEWAEVLAGEEFRLTLQLLSFWLQAEEDALDKEILPFKEWCANFTVWQEQPSIKDYAARMRIGGGAAEEPVKLH
ncbi:hypothetical protein LJB93_02665 [Desulfovibrio sp. OttesenSCG-928-F07]|nr:hypothetical protein [Desulfovibrio sp. OttesenSCG-928-F07]